MTTNDLTDMILKWGYVINPTELDSFKYYVGEMLKRERVLTMWKGKKIKAIILFHVTNDYESVLKKSLWTLPEEVEDGHQLYLDKIVCEKMTLQLRRAIERELRLRFPKVNECYYHRAPYDRCTKILRYRRRFSNGLRSEVLK